MTTAKEAIEEVIQWMCNVENPSDVPGWAQAVIDNLKAYGFEICKIPPVK